MIEPVLAPVRPTLATALRVAIVVAVVSAMLVVEATSRSGVTWRLITFTYQANILAAAYYLWTMTSPRAEARSGLRGAVVLYVVVAGVIWNLFLTEMSMGYTVANTLLHVVVPVLALIDWLVVGRSQGQVRWWQPFAWLVYPAAYLLLALAILNSAGRRPPYYFLDYGSVGMAGLAQNVAILTGGFLMLGFLLAVTGKATARLNSRA
ncbi:MAG: Pr6Pr family membrane protein [Mycobacterium sp.]